MGFQTWFGGRHRGRINLNGEGLGVARFHGSTLDPSQAHGHHLKGDPGEERDMKKRLPITQFPLVLD